MGRCACIDRWQTARRRFLLGAAAAAAVPLSGFVAAATSRVSLRISAAVVADLSIGDVSGGSFSIQPAQAGLGSGVVEAVTTTAREIRKVFGLPDRVALVVFDDRNRATYAAVDGRIEGDQVPQQAVILVGERMTRLLLETFADHTDGAAVSGALAHEMAHVYQFIPRQGGSWWNRMLAAEAGLSRRRAELHADFLAGWCLGVRGFGDIDIFSRRLFALGDTDIGDPNDHGAPEQRYAACVRGYYAGSGDRFDLERAAAEGELFVNAIVPMRSEP